MSEEREDFENYRWIGLGPGGFGELRNSVAVNQVREKEGRPLTAIIAQITAESLSQRRNVAEAVESTLNRFRDAGDLLMHRIDERGQTFLAVTEDVVARGEQASWKLGPGELRIGE